MRKIGYQVLGLLVWKGLRALLRQRYGDAPRKVALGGVMLAVIGALVLAGRRAASE
jgi:hypothetical protein